MSQYLRTTNGSDVFDFCCKGCGAEYELAIPTSDGMEPFGCPEGCGATYVRWRPDGKEPALQCVVQPMSPKG
jgi:hypothetical protein